jgi:phage-related minor tail protein
MAGGGPVFGGSSYLVGERGPELFVPSSSGSIVPGGRGGSVTVNVQNNTGQPIEKKNVRASFDAQGMVIDMVLDGITRNVHGIRNALGGA